MLHLAALQSLVLKNKLCTNAALSKVSVDLSSGDISNSSSVVFPDVPNVVNANCSQAEIIYARPVSCSGLSPPVVTLNLFGTGVRHEEKKLKMKGFFESTVSGCIEEEGDDPVVAKVK